jgi:hypothetical protein
MDNLLHFLTHPVVLIALAFGSTLGIVTFLASAGTRRYTHMATTLAAFATAFGAVLQFV